MNILNKQGMLSDSDRKQPLSHTSNYFTFESCLDLSIGIKVIPLDNYPTHPISRYSQDLASFMCWWNHFVMKDLNGFSDFSHVNFELIGFTII